MNLITYFLAEGISNDDIFGIHTELKLPPQKNHLGLVEDDNTELESVSGMFDNHLHIIQSNKIVNFVTIAIVRVIIAYFVQGEVLQWKKHLILT